MRRLEHAVVAEIVNGFDQVDDIAQGFIEIVRLEDES